jgi:hypothetical protein
MATRARKPAPKSSAARDRGRAQPMTDRQIIALIEERESRANQSGTFHEDTAESIRYYLGLPFGNEVEGRSQVVMREVYSTIEWIKPMLLKMFFGGDQVVKFAPKGPEDVKQAEQETDVVHHVVVNTNDGFATLYTWFTEAMLTRNSYAVAYWDERTDVTESTYEDLSIEEVTLLMQDGESEIVGSEESVDEQTGEPRFTVTIRTAEKAGRVMIDTIPTERVFVEAGYKHVSLSRSTFCGYWEEKTLSQLREEGFDVPDSLADDEEQDSIGDSGRDIVENARNMRDLSWRRDYQGDEEMDAASRKVKVRTIFMRADTDGDGIAEMRRLVVVGDTILQNEMYDRVLIAALTPTIMPHRHYGMSIADAVKDLQEIKSTLMRGMLDGMYLSLNGRHAVNEDIVNLDDMLVNRPGGVVRVAGDPNSAISSLVVPNQGGAIIQTIEYMDSVLENRTGASPRVLQGQSFDGNAINKTATGINAIMSAALARIELIARVFAETGVKELFQIVHTLLLKHNRKPTVMQLRNEFVPVDPRSWKKRTDMTVEVGLGTGDKQAKIALLQMLATAQQGLMAIGLANPQTIYNTMSKIVAEAGYKNPEDFFVNPNKPGYEPPQAPQDPKAMAEQAKTSLEQERMRQMMVLEAQKLQHDAQKTQTGADLERAKAFLDAQVKLAQSILDKEAQAEQVQMGAAREDVVRRETMDREDARAAEDRRTRLAEKGVDERGRPVKPRRKVVRHHRGPDGRIAASEVIEVDDEETNAQES